MAQVKKHYATGRRKCSSARVYLMPAEEGKAVCLINGKTPIEYFGNTGHDLRALHPLSVTEKSDTYSLKISVSGGGVSGQAQAIGHGIARALQTVEPELRPVLKKEGLLRRDPRIVERKKPGRHKARKKPQFSKR
ncbi:MAG TPA: 30S ribosomal protein S9 [Oligoflexia bacterium]|nr:30S ribosomal protein S9 [Oligoflexia bacterium]HMP49779.1 30S ribosomal protein S9 [Oligoflexia bacterium]